MRIELKNITPPEEIRLTMEKQMTAERTRRAVVTTAEGEKSSAILRAEGQKQSQIVNAEGAKQAAILAAEGQAEARLRVAQAEAQAIQVVAQALGARRQPGAVPDRAELSRVARPDRRPTRRSWCSCRTKPAACMASLGGIKELLAVEVGRFNRVSAVRLWLWDNRSMSLQGRTIAIRGNVDCVEDLLIEGRIEGHIWNENHVVTIGADAGVTGDIVARQITVRGAVEGTLMATGRVDIMDEAVVGRVLSEVDAGRGRPVPGQGRATASRRGAQGRASPPDGSGPGDGAKNAPLV